MNRTEALKKFRTLFETLSYAQDYATTFSSFLDFALWRLAPYCAEQMKDELTRLDKMYKESMSPVICEMFDCWSIACDDDGDGFYDALGDLFMECVSFGKNGQFFTPQPICDMVARMVYSEGLEEGKTVIDMACGSGAMLLSMAKLQRNLHFYGADNDLTCVKMATLNLLVNSMRGEIAWMNSLSMEHYKSYHINLILTGTHYLPMLTITGKNETHLIKKLRSNTEERTAEKEIIIDRKNQLALF